MLPCIRIAAKHIQPILSSNVPARILSKLPPLRHSSTGLPDKKDEHSGEGLAIPKEKWDPVPQRFLKIIRVEHHGIEPAKFNDSTIWYPIYKFPYLGLVRALVRFKVYVTFTSLGVCLTKFADIIWTADATFSIALVLSGTTLFGMYLAGDFARKLIVQIYTTGDEKYVRLSRFTFSAQRQDIVLPSSLVIPLTDTNDTHRKLLLSLKTNSPEDINLKYDNYEFYDESFNVILVFDGIHDVQKFEKVFGKILRRHH